MELPKALRDLANLPSQALQALPLDRLPNPFASDDGVGLDGKVVAITGGARGIGRAIAELLVAEGALVAIGDLDLDLARATADELGDNVRALPLDVTKRDSFARFLDDTEDVFGPIDVLINNAGIMLVGAFHKEEDAASDLMIDINVRGVLTGCKLIVPKFLDRGDGHIVNIASLAGKVGLPDLVTYCGTKHAVIGMSDALRVELRDKGITVTAVLPNAVTTELGAGLGESIVPKATAAEVAETVVWTIRHRKSEATVPRWSGKVTQPAAALAVDAREALTRRLGGHEALTGTDHKAREAYEQRARASRS